VQRQVPYRSEISQWKFAAVASFPAKSAWISQVIHSNALEVGGPATSPLRWSAGCGLFVTR